MQDATPSQQAAVEVARPRSLLAGRGKLVIAVGLLVVAMGYFAYTAFASATVFYFTVGEVLEGRANAGETVRVNGKLVPDSFRRDADGTLARFDLTDGTKVLPAVHDGILPALFFNEQSEIVLQGVYGESGVFQSQMVVVKCPSKYQSVAAAQQSETS